MEPFTIRRIANRRLGCSSIIFHECWIGSGSVNVDHGVNLEHDEARIFDSYGLGALIN